MDIPRLGRGGAAAATWIFQGDERTPQVPGLVAVARRVVEEEGVSTLFSGALERVLRSAPQFGVTLAVYDVLTTYCVDQGWLS